jgi:hypothetical protein
MRKKILVISHERSGTHFLINTIAQCFEYLPNQIDLVNTSQLTLNNPEAIRRCMRQYRGCFVANVFKSHHAYPFFAPLLPELLEEFIVFYIQRDGRDVMTSFWTYLNRLPAAGWGPKVPAVGEFMRATSTGRFTQFQATRRPITMLQRWVEHVEGWNRANLPIHRVSYEALHTQYDNVVNTISEIIGQPPVRMIRPTLDSPSSLPWRGRVGTWKEFFTEADEEYFARNTKRLFAGPKRTVRQRMRAIFRL